MKRLTIQHCHELAKIKDGKCLSLEYKDARSSLKWSCNKCNNTWSTSLTAIKNNNTWCRNCKTIENANKRRKKFTVFTVIATSYGGKCLSLENEYINNKSVLAFQCSKHHTWKTRAAHVVRGSWCPICKVQTSKPENKCRNIFETKFNKSFPTVRPNFLKNPGTNRNLELDGYCEELKLAFEYDGEQHFKEWNIGNETLEYRQDLDKLKDHLCKINSITLIRIPYWEKDNLEEYIEDKLDGYK